MRNDDSYEAYKRKFNLGVVGVIILMLVLWFGNFDGSNHNWELLVKNIGTTKATYRCSDSSITDLITDLFWDEHNQEMLEKSKQEAKKATPNGKSPKTDARPAKSNSILIPTSLTDGARSISVFRCLFTAG